MNLEPSATPSIWHAGERAMQEHVGVAARIADVGPRVIRDHLIEQHQLFYPLLPFVVLGAVDGRGQPWATLRAGHPGFLQASDTRTLQVAVPRDAADPADAGLNDSDAVGLLGIDPRTRRRNRLNGVVQRHADERFAIAVTQSYGNCPKYIQLRAPEFTRDPGQPAPPAEPALTALDDRARAIIGRADAFFVASYVDAGSTPAEGAENRRQVDVSHRGGKPGFVRVGADGVLTVPDFVGNQFFNTLGNLRLNPRAGLVFVDFARGDLLQMTGTVELLLDSPETATFTGAERLWRFAPTRVIHRPGGLPLRFEDQPDGASPNALATGDWAPPACSI